MARVVAIGGVFVRAADPAALAAWYADALGVDFADGAAMAVLPDTGSGYAVLSFFARDSDYLGDPGRQQAMVNLRVDDLDGVLARLDGHGVAHDPIEEGEYGRFAWLVDPEGRRVELWQPA